MLANFSCVLNLLPWYFLVAFFLCFCLCLIVFSFISLFFPLSTFYFPPFFLPAVCRQNKSTMHMHGALNGNTYLFENWDAFLAFFKPYFFLSTILASLVRNPAFLSAPLNSPSAFKRALETPCLKAPA